MHFKQKQCLTASILQMFCISHMVMKICKKLLINTAIFNHHNVQCTWWLSVIMQQCPSYLTQVVKYTLYYLPVNLKKYNNTLIMTKMMNKQLSLPPFTFHNSSVVGIISASTHWPYSCKGSILSKHETCQVSNMQEIMKD